MDKSHFMDKCKMLCNVLFIEMPNNITLDDYFGKFKHLTNERFSEAIEYLKDNTKAGRTGYVRFPIIWDFKEAVRLTMKPFDNVPESEELSPEDKKDVQKAARNWADKFKPPNKKDKLPSQVDLYNRMYKAEKIYSLKLRKWVHKSLRENIGGEFSEPYPVGTESGPDEEKISTIGQIMKGVE